MRKALTLLWLIPTLLFAMGGKPSATTLHPALLVDRSGQSVTVANLLCDDRDYFTFKRGEFTVKIPFSKVDKVLIQPAGDKISVTIVFKDGRRETFFAEEDAECVGVNESGTVEVFLSSLREIDFLQK